MAALARYMVLCGWVSLCAVSVSLKAETLHFATIDYCPFTCDPSKEGGREGFMTDVLRRALEPAGYSLQIESLPYVRAVESVRAGRHDGIVVVGRDFAPDLVYPQAPTVVQRVAFLVNQDATWEYTGVESLTDVKVGIVKGYHYVDPDLVAYLAREQRNEQRVHLMHGQTTTQRGLGMLLSGRITTFLEGEYSAMYNLRKMGVSEKVKVAGYTREAFEDYTGFSPENPDAIRLAHLLSDTLRTLKTSGALDEILGRYGITQHPAL